MSEISIIFPSMEADKMEKIKKTILELADCLNTKVSIVELNTIQVSYDSSSAEIGAIINKLAGNPIINTKGIKRGRKPKFPSNTKMESGLDKYGS